MNLLLELTVRGTLVFLLVAVFDQAVATRMTTKERRWYRLLVPLAFLFTVQLPIWPSWVGIPVLPQGTDAPHLVTLIQKQVSHTETVSSWTFTEALGVIWLMGTLGYLTLVLVHTRQAMRRWSRERLCTDSRLLDLLEDAKADAGVTAPIGLVVSEHIAAPAILGWLRPRILLPRELSVIMTADEIRAVFLHELAHFRSLDIPCNWLFSLVCALHWFNPVAHLAFRSWRQFREEAADEAAMSWMKPTSGTSYGETLLLTLRMEHQQGVPYGALAIGETLNNLKRRVTMINHYKNKTSRPAWAGILLILITTCVIIRPVRADDPEAAKTTAVAAMQVWLGEMDQQDYKKSWEDAAPSFQKALSAEKWVEASQAVRKPLGKCVSRKLASANHQTADASGTTITPADYIIAQFDSSFENLKYAVETVTFEKTADGWKAAGYYIKPK